MTTSLRIPASRVHLIGVDGGSLYIAVAGQQHREVLIGQHYRQARHEQRAIIG